MPAVQLFYIPALSVARRMSFKSFSAGSFALEVFVLIGSLFSRR